MCNKQNYVFLLFRSSKYIAVIATIVTVISSLVSYHIYVQSLNMLNTPRDMYSIRGMMDILKKSQTDPPLNTISDVDTEINQTMSNIKLPETKQCRLDYICKDRPQGVISHISEEALSFQEIWQDNIDVTRGGSWRPDSCTQESLIALIIPYRDRELHLKVFIKNIIPFLKAQKKAFTIFLVEQIGPQMFNKALMMNAGFIESQKLGNYTCFIFHDVDMIPVNLCNLYECPKTGMRHLGLSRDLKKPHYVYSYCVGGASAFTKDVFTQINGFTNVMFGWGGEDDDAFFRLLKQKIRIRRYSAVIGNYLSLSHNTSGSTNPKSYRGMAVVHHHKFMDYDGLNTVNYTVKSITKELLFTKITVSVAGPTTTEGVSSYFAAKKREFKEMLKHTATTNQPTNNDTKLN